MSRPPTAAAEPAGTLTTGAPSAEVLPPAAWKLHAEAHRARVDRIVGAHDVRRAEGTRHPVEDFLFSYYRLRPAQLRQWHPGVDFALLDSPEHAARRFYRTDADGLTSVDAAAFAADRADTVALLGQLLPATAIATPHFGCFGLHEWAMVHGQPDTRRHRDWPLRLGADGTNAVVESHVLRCTHYDAFRFFTPSAAPLNQLQPTVWSRVELEQPGCLHANMDLYKWSYKLLPVVSSALVLDCLELAHDVRELDMRASPYDFSALGYSPVPIETAEGKAHYVAAQRAFTQRSTSLRAQLMSVVKPLTRL